MPRKHLPSRGDHFSGQTAVHVRFERQHHFGLRSIAFDDDGQRFGEVAERLIDDVLAYASSERLGANVREPV